MSRQYLTETPFLDLFFQLIEGYRRIEYNIFYFQILRVVSGSVNLIIYTLKACQFCISTSSPDLNTTFNFRFQTFMNTNSKRNCYYSCYQI